jgi:hypothetical protein
MNSSHIFKYLPKTLCLLAAVAFAVLCPSLKPTNFYLSSFTDRGQSEYSFARRDGLDGNTDLHNVSFTGNNDHHLKSLLSGAHPDVIVPVLTTEEFGSIPWANSSRYVERDDGIKVLHNYTVVTGANGRRRTLFTKSEFIKNHKYLLSRGLTQDWQVPPSTLQRDRILAIPALPFRTYTWKLLSPFGKGKELFDTSSKGNC